MLNASRSPGDFPVPRRWVLPLLENRAESPTVRTFRFSTEGTDFRYLSNQAVRVALPGVADPWGAARTFSMSSSPTEPGTLAVTCRISETPFKQALASLRPGDTAHVIGPLGHFLFDADRPALFLAGGIGITPFRGMIRYAVDRELREPMRLLYSSRSVEELVFRSELDGLARDGGPLTVHYTITRPVDSSVAWPGRVGRIDADWIDRVGGLAGAPRVYVAGLPAMVGEMVTLLQSRFAVPANDIAYEMFHGF